MTPDVAAALAPTGTLRVAVWRLDYFAVADSAGRLAGIIPDLGNALARRLRVPVALAAFATPAAIVAAFHAGDVDVTFLGITADRADAMCFGPTVVGLQSSFLVTADSPITSMEAVAWPGTTIVVPARSAQEAHLRATHPHARLLTIPPEAPGEAIARLAAGDGEAFCHVVPMLAAVQPRLPGSRILPGSTFTVPVAIASTRGRPPAAAAFCRRFAADVKASGLVADAIARAGVKGVVVGEP